MGMYTEVFVNVDLKEDTPLEVIETLRAMCAGQHDSDKLKDKPFRWAYLFNNGSHYTPLTCCGNLTFNEIANCYSLLGKGDIKNYENEIKQFFTWLMPYIDAEKGDFIGYTRFEEEKKPRLIFKC